MGALNNKSSLSLTFCCTNNDKLSKKIKKLADVVKALVHNKRSVNNWSQAVIV